MKLTRSISKNLKILARSKGSALVVLLAPLIIVFIIGLGFMDNPELQLNIGVHQKEPSELTQRYINSFNTSEHNIILYENEEMCRNSINDGVTVLCAVFSEDFDIRDDAKNELTFFVDESRANLVDKLIASFSETLGTETADITEELAEQLIRIIDISSQRARETLTLTIANRAEINKAKTQTSTAESAVSQMDTSTESINMRTIKNRIDDVEDDFKDLLNDAKEVIKKAEDVTFNEANESEKELKEAIEQLEKIVNETRGVAYIDDIKRGIDDVSDAIESLVDRLEKAGTAKTTISQNLQELNSFINTIDKNTDEIKT